MKRLNPKKPRVVALIAIFAVLFIAVSSSTKNADEREVSIPEILGALAQIEQQIESLDGKVDHIQAQQLPSIEAKVDQVLQKLDPPDVPLDTSLTE